MEKSSDFKFVKPGEIRTRFAPSPTGFLHVGSARTALFNFLFSRNNQGSFILRIEDTDIGRLKKGSEKDIMDSLKWLSIEWDEGPDTGGNYGPYRQSQRMEIYKRYLEKLLAQGKAYHCFCSEQDLEAERQYLLSTGRPPIYSGKCSQLSGEEVEKNLAERKSSIVRFRSPKKVVIFDDLIRGKIEFDTALIGDFAIARNSSLPLYNFACVVDDFEMKISHVIRGEEHISNTPKQILLQEALGLDGPLYAHLPMILGPNRAKLSKRQGAVGVFEYKKLGYLPEALVNFIAFLGWNPGTEREIFSLSSLVKEFSLERVKKAGAIFNIRRLDFLNGFYIRQKTVEEIARNCLPYLMEAGLIKEKAPKDADLSFETMELEGVETGENIEFETLKMIVACYHERLKKLSEIVELADFFFKKRLDYPKELLRWREQTDRDVVSALDRTEKILANVEEINWNKENLNNLLTEEAERLSREKNIEASPPATPGEALRAGDRGYLLWPLRISLTGKKASAGPFEISEILGKEKTLQRIKEAKEKMSGNR